MPEEGTEEQRSVFEDAAEKPVSVDGEETGVPSPPPKDKGLPTENDEQDDLPPAPPSKEDDEAPHIDLGLAAQDLHASEQPNEVDPRLSPFMQQALSHVPANSEAREIPEKTASEFKTPPEEKYNTPMLSPLPGLKSPTPIEAPAAVMIDEEHKSDKFAPAAKPREGAPEDVPPEHQSEAVPRAEQHTSEEVGAVPVADPPATRAIPELLMAATAAPAEPATAEPAPAKPAAKPAAEPVAEPAAVASAPPPAEKKPDAKPMLDEKSTEMLTATHANVQAMGKAMEAILQDMMTQKAAKIADEEEMRKLDEARALALEAHHNATVAALEKEREANAALIKTLETKVRFHPFCGDARATGYQAMNGYCYGHRCKAMTGYCCGHRCG